jgi:hypothetical protein
MLAFKSFIAEDEALTGYVISSLISVVLKEGRRKPGALAKADFTYKPTTTSDLFNTYQSVDPKDYIDKMVQRGHPGHGEEGDVCQITPLSGYATHIGAIQSYAHSSPENMAQVLMFSPLSANTNFAKHWDNFQALMMILKYEFPQTVTKEQINQAVKSFNTKYHNLSFSISNWKLDTIAYIWSNKDSLFHELNQLAKGGDDIKLMHRLIEIPGVQAIKAGFIIQLLWGRAGCIDTHNIDIYSKVFPDLEFPNAAEMEDDDDTSKPPKDPWKNKGGVEKYMGLLGQLDKRGIGTKQLWDVWVDFVESMYIMITRHHQGYYDFQGPALDPNEPQYGPMKGITIPKKGIGRDKKGAMVPLVQGKVGMGASATHLPMDPDEALRLFQKMYRRGDPGTPASRAVAFRTDDEGKSLDQTMPREPTSLHYFEPALDPRTGEIDPDRVRHIIRKHIAKKKAADEEEARLGQEEDARIAALKAQQPTLW